MRASCLAFFLLVTAAGVAQAQTKGYEDAAKRIQTAALGSNGAYTKLSYLTDRIGHRLTGSAALEKAIAWAVATLTADGHENVHTEKVMAVHWVRGEERATVVSPVVSELRMTTLGGSAATPGKGITAEVVPVDNFETLDALGAAGKLKGKIVFYTAAMSADLPPLEAYGKVSTYRSRGASRAAKHGVAAVLVRSVTAHSLRTPHTGGTWFLDGQKAIPAAALAIEDAAFLQRLLASGEPVKVKLVLGAKTLPDVATANVVAELVGREKPDEIVLLAAHLDSWDVGQGAHDDGSGVVMMMEALSTLRRLGLRPRRTIRVVLYTNEENGLQGAKTYVAEHAAELPRHVAALEADLGAFRPQGFFVQAPKADARGTVLGRLQPLGKLFTTVGATKIQTGEPMPDSSFFAHTDMALLGLDVDESTYFDVHHSEADTLDKVNPEDLRLDVAAVATMAWVLAEMPTRLWP